MLIIKSMQIFAKNVQSEVSKPTGRWIMSHSLMSIGGQVNAKR